MFYKISVFLKFHKITSVLESLFDKVAGAFPQNSFGRLLSFVWVHAVNISFFPKLIFTLKTEENILYKILRFL